MGSPRGAGAAGGGGDDSTVVYCAVVAALTAVILAAWVFASAVDASQPPGGACERALCGALYCFKRAGLKTRYCAVSRKKVPGMDHFCVWMNTAIGRRNYPAFFIVALFSVLLYAFQIALSVVAYARHAPAAVPVVLSTVNLLCAGGVGGLYAYLLAGHCYLIWRQISTFDYLMEKAKQRAEKRKAAKRAQGEDIQEHGDAVGAAAAGGGGGAGAAGAAGRVGGDVGGEEGAENKGSDTLEVTTTVYKTAEP